MVLHVEAGRMIRWTRPIYTVTAWLLVATVLIQVFLAGQAIFDGAVYASPDFDPHRNFALIVGLASLLLFILGFLARLPRSMLILTIVQFVLMFIQGFLPGLRSTSHTLAALHPVNALLIFGVALILA